MSKEFRHIVRIADTDLDGTKNVAYALTGIKGVGARLANVIEKKAEIKAGTRMGFLSEAELEKIETIIKEPAKYGLPGWLLDHRKDRDTGRNLHLSGSDLVLQTKNDIERLKKMRLWRGYRHAYSLKVRGQRTRTTGRKGKTLGVKKKRPE